MTPDHAAGVFRWRNEPIPIPSFTPARDDAEGEDAESKIRRLLETAGFPAGTTAQRVTVREKEAPKGADALSGASSAKTGIKVRVPLPGAKIPTQPDIGRRLNNLSRPAMQKAAAKQRRSTKQAGSPSGHVSKARGRDRELDWLDKLEREDLIRAGVRSDELESLARKQRQFRQGLSTLSARREAIARRRAEFKRWQQIAQPYYRR